MAERLRRQDDRRAHDVPRAQRAGVEERSDSRRRRRREVVRLRARHLQAGEHALLGRGRAAVVVDAEPGRHHDEQRADVDEGELGPEEPRVVRRLVEQARDRAEVARRRDHRNLDPEAAHVDGVGLLPEGRRDRRVRRRRRQEDVGAQEHVARRVAVGMRGRRERKRRSDERGGGHPARRGHAQAARHSSHEPRRRTSWLATAKPVSSSTRRSAASSSSSENGSMRPQSLQTRWWWCRSCSGSTRS